MRVIGKDAKMTKGGQGFGLESARRWIEDYKTGRNAANDEVERLIKEVEQLLTVVEKVLGSSLFADTMHGDD